MAESIRDLAHATCQAEVLHAARSQQENLKSLCERQFEIVGQKMDADNANRTTQLAHSKEEIDRIDEEIRNIEVNEVLNTPVPT